MHKRCRLKPIYSHCMTWPIQAWMKVTNLSNTCVWPYALQGNKMSTQKILHVPYNRHWALVCKKPSFDMYFRLMCKGQQEVNKTYLQKGNSLQYLFGSDKWNPGTVVKVWRKIKVSVFISSSFFIFWADGHVKVDRKSFIHVFFPAHAYHAIIPLAWNSVNFFISTSPLISFPLVSFQFHFLYFSVRIGICRPRSYGYFWA